MSKSIEDIVVETLKTKLDDGTIHKVVEDKINSIIERIIEDSLSWSSPAYKLMKEKVQSLMCECVEKSNFDDYIVKITDVLNGAFKDSSLEDHKAIVSSLNELLNDDSPASKIIANVTMNDIVSKYEEFLINYYKDYKDSFDDCDIQEDGESPFGYASLSYEVDIDEVSDRYSSYAVYEVTLTNQFEDEETSFVFRLRKNRWDSSGHFYIVYEKDHKLSDLRHMSSFEVFLLMLKKNMCHIDFNGSSDEVIDGEVCVEFED